MEMTSELEHRRDLAVEQTTPGAVPGQQTPFFFFFFQLDDLTDPVMIQHNKQIV